MAVPVILASDVMNKAAALLNDATRDLYTNDVQLPYLQMANEQLSDILESHGISLGVKNSIAISVPVGSKTLNLPADFLVPNKLWERGVGETDDDWRSMTERGDLVGFSQVNTLGVWSYKDDEVQFVGASIDREVMMKYDKSLIAIVSENSPTETNKFTRYLSRKTAELCARYIGMNSTLADELLGREVIPAENDLSTILVKNMQGVRHRRAAASNRAIGIIIGR